MVYSKLVTESKSPNVTELSKILERHSTALLEEWLGEQMRSSATRKDLMPESELREQSRRFLSELGRAVQSGNVSDVSRPEWSNVRELLDTISQKRAKQGFTPTETATFIFSLKLPLFNVLRRELSGNAEAIIDEGWTVTLLLDKLGLYTTEIHQRNREAIISRQQQEMLELSTPVVRLWNGILALPLIGTLDSVRTQIVMENLLQGIVETGAAVAILDITGVPTVDTLVAQHLLKTAAAARLMGAEVIISGIRPQTAQTIVHLGVDLQNVVTKATLADAFRLALRKTGQKVAETPNN